jgi:hypothetical protein
MRHTLYFLRLTLFSSIRRSVVSACHARSTTSGSHSSTRRADFVKVILAALEDEGGELTDEEAELALWQAGCEVLSSVGDPAGAQRCVYDGFLQSYSCSRIFLSQILECDCMFSY